MAFVSATKKTGRFTPIIRHALLIGAAFVMLYPLLWMIGSSFTMLRRGLYRGLAPRQGSPPERAPGPCAGGVST